MYNLIILMPVLIALTAFKLVFYTTFGTTVLLLAFVEILIYLKFVNRTRELKSRKRWIEKFL